MLSFIKFANTINNHLYYNYIPKIILKKNVLSWFIITRSSHEYFANYHKKFGHKKLDF